MGAAFSTWKEAKISEEQEQEQEQEALLDRLVKLTVEKLADGDSKEGLIAAFVESGMEQETAEELVKSVQHHIDKANQFNLGKYLLGMLLLYPAMALSGIFLFYLFSEIAGYQLIKNGIKGLKGEGLIKIIAICGIFEGIIMIIVGLYLDFVAIGLMDL